MLFKNSNILKQYAQLAGDVDLNSIRITMQSVEDKYLLPIMGKELYNSFITAYDDAQVEEDFNNAEQKKLLEKCRRVTAPFFCYHYAPKADVQVSNSGVQRSETESTKTAYQYQAANYREANFAEGEAAIEKLIEFLEDNQSDYPEWAESKEFKRYRSLFIKTAADFEEQYPSQTPYRNFWAMRSKMIDVEENIIQPFLGTELFTQLKEKDQETTPTFTDPEKELLKKLKKVIAYSTVATAIPFLSVKVEANGLTVVAAANFSTNDANNTRGGADNKALVHLINSCESSSKMWLQNTMNFLTENKADFENWVGFATPVATTTENTNAPFNNIFGFN